MTVAWVRASRSANDSVYMELISVLGAVSTYITGAFTRDDGEQLASPVSFGVSSVMEEGKQP